MADLKIMAIDDENAILDSIKDFFDKIPIQTFNNARNAINELRKTIMILLLLIIKCHL